MLQHWRNSPHMFHNCASFYSTRRNNDILQIYTNNSSSIRTSTSTIPICSLKNTSYYPLQKKSTTRFFFAQSMEGLVDLILALPKQPIHIHFLQPDPLHPSEKPADSQRQLVVLRHCRLPSSSLGFRPHVDPSFLSTPWYRVIEHNSY